MSRQSRFEKLEEAREADESQPASGASLERFGAEPELSPRAAPADPMAPEHGAERLQRFEEDGADGLGLDRDPLAALPMLQCLACGTDCGKFETVCHRCGVSLTSAEARAHNGKRLVALEAEKAAGREAERQQYEQDGVDGQLRMLERMGHERDLAAELHENYSGDSQERTRGRLWRLGGSGTALLLGGLTHGGLSALMFVIAGALALSLLPKSAWLRLGQKVRFRDRD